LIILKLIDFNILNQLILVNDQKYYIRY